MAEGYEVTSSRIAVGFFQRCLLQVFSFRTYARVRAFAMSKVIDVSSKLGEYMLKGWVRCYHMRSITLLTRPVDLD